MPIITSTHRGFTLPGANSPDRRLTDIQAIKNALVAIDADLANIEANAVQASSLGVNNGIAILDNQGLIPTNLLPSYVDDVLEFADFLSLPTTGVTGKIYVTLDNNKTFRWSGSAYIYITSGAVDSVAGKTGIVTLSKTDVDLANVNNTSDINKPVSNATATALDLKANQATTYTKLEVDAAITAAIDALKATMYAFG